MTNPTLPNGYVNGNRFKPSAALIWTNPNGDILNIGPQDVVEIQIISGQAWLNVIYSQASIDNRVAIETERAEAAEASILQQALAYALVLG